MKAVTLSTSVNYKCVYHLPTNLKIVTQNIFTNIHRNKTDHIYWFQLYSQIANYFMFVVTKKCHPSAIWFQRLFRQQAIFFENVNGMCG